MLVHSPSDLVICVELTSVYDHYYYVFFPTEKNSIITLFSRFVENYLLYPRLNFNCMNATYPEGGMSVAV